jgi:hypothetical protein
MINSVRLTFKTRSFSETYILTRFANDLLTSMNFGTPFNPAFLNIADKNYKKKNNRKGKYEESKPSSSMEMQVHYSRNLILEEDERRVQLCEDKTKIGFNVS